MPTKFVSCALGLLIGVSACLPAHCENQFLTQGIQEYRAGNYQDAAGHLGAALTTDFNNAVLHYYLGSCYTKLNQKASAVREYRIAYALSPEEEVGKLSRQALAILGAESGSSLPGAKTDVASMFIIPPPPKPNIPSSLQSTGGAELNELVTKLQIAYISRLFSAPNGGRDHSEKLQALGPEWRVGERFDDSKLPANDCDGPWFKLPNWIAGSWVAGSESVTQSFQSEVKEKTETNGEVPVLRDVPAERWGVVRDRQGNYWDHPCVPEVLRRSAGKKDVLVELVIKVQPVELNTQKVIIFKRSVRFKLDGNHVIRAVTQVEDISTYVPIGTGYFQKNQSEKQFDDRGNAVRVGRYRSVLKQASAPRVPAPGHDYAGLFRKYAQENRMGDLAP